MRPILPWLAGLFLATSLPAAEDGAITLPPFLVEEATKGPPWRHAVVERYEVLSRCEDAVTREVLDAHRRLQRLLAEILPPRLQVQHSQPVRILLVDERSQSAASAEVMARMLGDARPPVEVPAVDLGRGFRSTARPVRYSFLPNLRLWDRDGMTVFMLVRREGFDGDRLALTPDFASYLIRQRLPALPAWFVNGFIGLYEHVTYSGHELEVGPVEWLSPAATEALRRDPKSAPPPEPLAGFLAGRLVNREGETKAEALQRWRAQAIAFVRWIIEERDGISRAQFWDFIERSATLGPSDELFRHCCGIDYATATERFTARLPDLIRSIRRLEIRKDPLGRFPLANATELQVAHLKGDWERLEIPYVRAQFPTAVPKYVEQARRTLLRVPEGDRQDPGLLAVRALCEIDAGEPAAALPLLEQAAQGGPLRARAAAELGRLRLETLLASRREALTPTELASVLEPLFAARQLQPPQAEVYEQIAEAWLHSSFAPRPGHLAVVDEGVRLFPTRLPLLRRAAELRLLHGTREEAAPLVELGLKAAPDEASREVFRLLRDRLTR